MFQIRKDSTFFVCVTMGLALMASKYRDSVLRSVRQFYRTIFILTNTGSFSNNRTIEIESKPVIVVNSEEKCEYALQCIRHEMSDNVLGFDCEWVDKGPVSLLQLATLNGLCVLFRLNKIGHVPSKLKELLSSKHVLKVGVSPFDDGHKLKRDYGCNVLGTLDLRLLARCFGLVNASSLKTLAKEYLDIDMNKESSMRRSDWTTDSLTDEQINYAASDVICSVLIYHQMLQKVNQHRSVWGNFFKLSNLFWVRYAEDRLYAQLQDVIDARFKVNPDNVTHKQNSEINHNNPSKPKTTNNLPTRIKPLYHNCYLQAPDGETLCTCNFKKTEWYIERELGVVVSKQPYTVRLKFEPSGRAQGKVGRYYTQLKINCCVVCGFAEKFIRKNIVPREYRRHFPVVMKEHQSHDIVLLCPMCHQISNMKDMKVRQRLAEMCDAPLSEPSTSSENAYMSCWRRLRSTVRALRKQTALPIQKRVILESHIKELTGQEQITAEFLELLDKQLKSDPPLPSAQAPRTLHGLKVVEYFESRIGGLFELEQLWREHFLSTMKPKYMPSLWSVSHNQERLLLRLGEGRIDSKDARILRIYEPDTINA